MCDLALQGCLKRNVNDKCPFERFQYRYDAISDPVDYDKSSGYEISITII